MKLELIPVTARGSLQEVTDLLTTGGDPMMMTTKHLTSYIEPLLDAYFDHAKTIRIGTKALTFWPYRFVSDTDADEPIALIGRPVAVSVGQPADCAINWARLRKPCVGSPTLPRS